MKGRIAQKAFVAAAALVVLVAAPARAQSGVEVGTSLVSLMVNWDQIHTTTTFGIPSAGLATLSPGLYVSLFAGKHLAIEPQIGLIVISSRGNSEHFLNFAGQADYFLRNSETSSPFVFGNVGVISGFYSTGTPKYFSGGIGYRKLVGDRISIRFDGLITHFTDRLGNAVVIGVSLGGVFGRH